MNFTKYKSIKRATDVKTLQYYVEQGFDKLQWYATEKIHGCNFSFICINGEVRYAQRTMITEGIFNSQEDVHKVEAKIKELANHLGFEIQVFGEYFGGNIAGKSSIPYFKDNRKEFIFFDIYSHADKCFIPYPLNFELFDKFDIPRVSVLKEGTLQECLELDKSFNSKVAEIDTFAEGYVVKPFNSLYTDSTDRVILKMVAPEFDDIKKAPDALEHAKNKQVNFDIYNRTEDLIKTCLNPIRCDKVAAKFGIESIHRNQFGKLLAELVKDIMDESEETTDYKQIEKACIPTIKLFFQ